MTKVTHIVNYYHMSEQNKSTIEKTGKDFTVEGILHARKMTLSALEKISLQIQPGMLESDALLLAENTLKQMGSDKKWHRTWIRFGVNTLLPYGVLSEPNTRLKENDIYFIDLGPIWNGFEGDAGATFAVGLDEEMKKCAVDVKTIYDTVKEYWNQEKVSGSELYAFAEKTATSYGWNFTLTEANGHRLCDFPHAIHHKGPIADLTFSPSKYLWVLEIQIRHQTKPFGAFYEDLLV